TLDYRATMLALAYGYIGATMRDCDPYAVPGYAEHRDGIKALSVALLCVDEPLTRWPRKAGALFQKTGIKLVDVVAAVKAHHAVIAPLFETGIGLRLMFTESVILIDVLNSCARRAITALPIHDAVVVREDRADEVAVLMRAWFEAHAHAATAVTR